MSRSNTTAPESIHHFRLTPELLAALKADDLKPLEDMRSTALEMHEHDILRLPYPVIMLSFRIDDAVYTGDLTSDHESIGSIFTFMAWDKYIILDERDTKYTPVPIFDLSPVHIATATGREVIIDPIKVPNWVGDPEGMKREEYSRALGGLLRIINDATLTLVVALATRNVVKQTSTNKRAHRGIGNGKFRGPRGEIYISSTVVQPPTYTSPGNGTPKCAHWRRGHKHTYRVGAGRTGTRERWVAPIFVNADPEYVQPVNHKYVVTK